MGSWEEHYARKFMYMSQSSQQLIFIIMDIINLFYQLKTWAKKISELPKVTTG